jgi:hypothetical protein
MTDPNATPSNSGSSNQGAGGNFASLLWDTEILSSLKGPLAIGLSVAEDKDLNEQLKLEIVNPKLFYTKGSGLYLLDEAGARQQIACANIALLVAYNVAAKHRIETKPYGSLEHADLHKGLEVAAAFAVAYYGSQATLPPVMTVSRYLTAYSSTTQATTSTTGTRLPAESR